MTVFERNIEGLFPKMCKHVKIGTASNFRDILKNEKLIKQFEKQVCSKLKTKFCYTNALLAFKFLQKKGFNVEYIEGFADLGGIVAEHGWNAITIDGVRHYFDVTATELGNEFGNDYVEVFASSDLDSLKAYFKRNQLQLAIYQRINWINKGEKPTEFQVR